VTASRVKKISTSLLAFVAAFCVQPAPAASSSVRARQQGPQESAAKWERYAFPGDEFSVELPGMPYVYHQRRLIGDFGRDSDTMRVFGLYADGVVFMVVAYDRPRRGESFDLFAGHLWGRARLKGTATEVTLDGFRGREYRRAETGALTTRVFKTDGHAYIVHAFAPAERQPLAERFLDSLTLSAAPRGHAIVETAMTAPRFVETPPAVLGPGRGENSHGDRKDAPAPPPQSADDDPARVFNPKDVTQKAVIVYLGDPGFTEEARLNNVSGVVRLRAVLHSTGRVTNIGVVKGLPDGLTERAIYTARHVLFFPAVKDGRAVSQHILLEYNFNVY
jgi:TonB family protein